MKRIFCLSLLILLSGAAGLSADDPSRDILYQVSTLSALMEGGYDGLINVADIKSHGDFGIGTFEGLDGEMILLKGTVYQARGKGAVTRAKAYTLISFADVTPFDADHTLTLAGITDLAQLERALDISFPESNIPIAIKLHGLFSYIKTRCVPAQKKPYPRLAEATRNQPVFERRDIAGTIVGFRFPSYFQAITEPGYHLNFISDDKTFGGRLVDVAATHINAVVDDTPTFLLPLPTNKPFNALKLPAATTTEITAIEK